MNLQKLKDGILMGTGFILMVGLGGFAYAAFTWVTQSNVTAGSTLTATAWNDMLNNQNYLKQEAEVKVNKAGDTMAGILNMGNQKITNLGTPVATTDAATKAYADSVSASGEGRYQISCSNHYGANTSPYCIRIDTITGTTQCKVYTGSYLWGTTTWSSCTYNPW